MSRIGKRPIPIPNGVTVSIGEEAVEVKGPKGQLRQPLPPGISVRDLERRGQGGARAG